MLFEVPSYEYAFHQFILNIHTKFFRLPAPDTSNVIKADTAQKVERIVDQLEVADRLHMNACDNYLDMLNMFDQVVAVEITELQDKCESLDQDSKEYKTSLARLNYHLGLKGLMLNHRKQIEIYLHNLESTWKYSSEELQRMVQRYADTINGQNTESKDA